MIFKKSDTVLGLDIGTHAIKLVEMSHSSKGSVITNCGYVPVPQDKPEYDISDDLKDCLSKHNIRTKRAVIAVSTEKIEWNLNPVEKVIPPDFSSKELRELVWPQVVDDIADAYDSIIDFQFLKNETVNGKPGAQVLSVAVNREDIKERITLLKKIGLTPVAIDVDLFAIERLVEYIGQLPNDSYATIIDIGNSKASMGFYQNGILNHISDVSEGGRDITKEIADNLEMELDEAEVHKLKETLFEKAEATDIDGFYKADENAGLFETEPSDSNPDMTLQANGEGATSSQEPSDSYFSIGLDGDMVNGDVPSSLEGDMVWQPKPEIVNILGDNQRHGLYQSLQTCFRAYETDFSDAQLSKIILTGGTSQMKHLADFFTAKLEIPTETIHYTAAISLQEGNKNLEALKTNEPTYAVATGLALKLAPRVRERPASNVTESEEEE